MANTKIKKKKKSQAPIALVYFITLLVCLGVLAMFSLWILGKYNVIGVNEDDQNVTQLKCMNTLFVRENDSGVLYDMSIMRIDPNNEQIIFIPIPAQTVDTKSLKTFKEILTDDTKIEKLKEAVSETFGVTIDNYATITNEAFETAVDICGGMTYTADQELYYLSDKSDYDDVSIAAGEMLSLPGRQIRLILQYPVFAEGKAGNLKFLSQALEQIVNNAFIRASITKDHLDNLYEILTTNSTTNITNDDFQVIKSYMRTMLNDEVIPAYSLLPEGAWQNDEKFTVNSDYLEKVDQVFNGSVNVATVDSQAPVGEAADEQAVAATTTTAADSQVDEAASLAE